MRATGAAEALQLWSGKVYSGGVIRFMQQRRQSMENFNGLAHWHASYALVGDLLFRKFGLSWWNQPAILEVKVARQLY